jgi:hypothetical protein
MNKAEAHISAMLLKAIGWEQHFSIQEKDDDFSTVPFVLVGDRVRPFDFRDPTVIWPIAKRYRCYPSCFYVNGNGFKESDGYEAVAHVPGGNVDFKKNRGPLQLAETPELAIASAVIALYLEVEAGKGEGA